jgi:hypothetical protein
VPLNPPIGTGRDGLPDPIGGLSGTCRMKKPEARYRTFWISELARRASLWWSLHEQRP